MNPTIQSPQVQQYANEVDTAFNNPDITSAGNTVSSLQQQAGQSSAAEQSLPTLLQQSLAGSINQNDPDIQKNKTDLATYLSDLGNPSGAADQAASQIPGAILSPSQQRQITSSRLGNEAANISSDNLVTGLRLGGIANIIHSAAAAQATNTQNLLAKLNAAQTTYQQLFDKAQTHAGFAMKLEELAQSSDQFNQSLALQKAQLGLNPLAQANTAYSSMANDAKNMNFHNFMAKYENDPRLAGITAQKLYDQYTSSGGKGVTNEDIFHWSIDTGNFGQKLGIAASQLIQNPTALILGGYVGSKFVPGIFNATKSGVGSLIDLMKGGGGGNVLASGLEAAAGVAPEAGLAVAPEVLGAL